MADSNIDLEYAILQEILNMGYQITPENLDEIKREFLRLEESSSEGEGFFSGYVDEFGEFPNLNETIIDPIHSIENALATPRRTGFGSDFTLQTDGLDPLLVSEFNELMQMGYNRLQNLYDEIVRVDELLNNRANSRRSTLVDLQDQPGPSRKFFPTQTPEDEVFIEDESLENIMPQTIEIPKRKPCTKPRAIEADFDDFHIPDLTRPAQSRKPVLSSLKKPAQKLPTTWKTNKTLEMRKAMAQAKAQETNGKDNIRDLNLTPDEEKRLLRMYYREHALKPIQNIKPGDLPFKHDPVARYEKYKQFWEKFPVPGDEKLEKERLKLRWMIRDLMLKWDRPTVKLVPKSHENKNINPEWVP